MMTLTEIGLETGTDKAGFHGYTDFYDTLFSPIRDQKLSVLEIGTLSGQSLRMWDRYFTHPGTKITGVDIHEWWTPEPSSRIKMHIGSGTSHEFMKGVYEAAGPFDVVIDDAGHFCGDQKQTLAIMWPYIKPGGILATEDLHTSYSNTYITPGDTTFVEHLLGWIHDLNESGKDMCGKPSISTVSEIIFRKSLVVLRKR